MLGRADIVRLKSSAAKAGKVETEWNRKLKKAIEHYEPLVLHAIEAGIPLVFLNIDFYPLVARHAYESMLAGLTLAESDTEITKKVKDTKLASRGAKLPRTLHGLKLWWDKLRRGEIVSKRIQKNADAIKTRYLEKCQSVWEKHSQPFRAGQTFNQKEVVSEIRDAARVTTSRAAMIVTTETTNYYNTVRRNYYDASDAVTHYLFMAIRDHRTTPWCKTRSGLVYKKGSDYLKNESPACHWSCRSEIVPLVSFNPNHKKLIMDPTLQRENNTPTPLPPEWKRKP